MITVDGIFDPRADAERIVGRLRAAGVQSAQLTPDASDGEVQGYGDDLHDPAESGPVEPKSEPAPPDAEQEQPSASTTGLPPWADPANWVDHED